MDWLAAIWQGFIGLDVGPQAGVVGAVSAIPKQTAIPKAKVRIIEALEEAANGHANLAEVIFSEVAVRKAAVGKAANKEAAEVARHLGTLAFLHDTQKALNAYRRATALDSDNPESWNQLGRLLFRAGEINHAAAAFRRVESIGEATNDRVWLAAAYGNLSNVAQIRGDLDQAEQMHRKALLLFEDVGAMHKAKQAQGSLDNLR